MALTKLEFWIASVVIVLSFAFSMVIVGSDLVKNDITLDQRSIDYINNYSNVVDSNNFEEFADNETLAQKEKNPLVDFATSLPLVEDVLGGINFFIDKTKVVLRFISVIYNFPSFFLEGFGLPVGAFKHILNIVGTALFVAVVIMGVRLVK